MSNNMHYTYEHAQKSNHYFMNTSLSVETALFTTGRFLTISKQHDIHYDVPLSTFRHFMDWLRRALHLSSKVSQKTPVQQDPITKKATHAPPSVKAQRSPVNWTEDQIREYAMEKMTSEQDPQTKVLTVGIESSVSDALEQAGYEIHKLDLGCPYYFEPDALLQALPPLPEFPHDYKEHEIVVVDLTRDAVSRDSIAAYSGPAKGVKAWWAPNDTGRVNPSLLHGTKVRQAFDRILFDGGFFFVFLGAPESQGFHFGSNSGGLYGLDVVENITCDNLSFLSILGNGAQIDLRADTGKSIEFAPDMSRTSVIGAVLKKYLPETIFHCTISPGYAKEKMWIPILVNKFGSPVGALLSYGKGTVILLPDFDDKSSLLNELLRDTLPEIAPHLFPSLSKSTWTTDATYEPSDISLLVDEIEMVRKRADAEILALETKIA